MNKNELLDFLQTANINVLDKLNGLPAGLKKADISSLLDHENNWHGVSKIGSENKIAQYFYITAPAFEEQVRGWMNNDEIIFMLDIKDPFPDPLFQEQLKSLRDPETKLDTYSGLLFLKEGEWVWSSRGLAMYISSDNFMCYQLILFEPVTVDHYRKYLRPNLKTRRIPE